MYVYLKQINSKVHVSSSSHRHYLCTENCSARAHRNFSHGAAKFMQQDNIGVHGLSEGNNLEVITLFNDYQMNILTPLAYC